MKFGGLSELEIQKISQILDSENITFKIETDSDIAAFNERSMQNNLRHLSPPNLSTHILSIQIDDNDFDRISQAGKNALLDFGITNIAPTSEDFHPFSGETFHQEMADAPKKIVGVSFAHQAIIAIVLGLFAIATKYVWDMY